MKVIWAAVIALFLLGVFVLTYTLSLGSLTIVYNLADATNSTNPIRNDVFTGYFQVDDVRFYDRLLVESTLNSSINRTIEDLCNDSNSEEIIIIEMLLYNEKLPDNCELFIDTKFIKKFQVESILCYSDCVEKESIFTITEGGVNIHETHEIEICCEGICHVKNLNSLC